MSDEISYEAGAELDLEPWESATTSDDWFESRSRILEAVARSDRYLARVDRLLQRALCSAWSRVGGDPQLHLAMQMLWLAIGELDEVAPHLADRLETIDFPRSDPSGRRRRSALRIALADARMRMHCVRRALQTMRQHLELDYGTGCR